MRFLSKSVLTNPYEFGNAVGFGSFNKKQINGTIAGS
jgi:hypothetical protein